MSTMDKMELKIPPVVLWLLAGFLMWLSAKALPQFSFGWPHQREIAFGLVSAGVLIALLGVISFRRARTTVDPRYPANVSALVTSGIYRVTRNPMYLGMLVTLAGWACWLGQFLSFVFLPLFIVLLNRLQIIPEERALAQIFGPGFAAYRTRVRRWI